MNRSGRGVYSLALFVFFICLFISIYPDVFFFKASFMKRDIFRYYFPVWQFSIENIREGHFPLWNPYSSYGVPFFANIQSCVLYPLSLILYWPDYLWAFNFYILLHLALAGFFVSLWMASCGASRWAQLISGMAYGLSGYVMASANVTISLCTLSYFPIVLFCFRKATRCGGLRWKFATAVMLVVQYLAGDPAIFFASILVLSMIVIYETIRIGWRDRRCDLRSFWASAIIFLLFLGLAAFHVLLFVEFLFHSNRSTATSENAARWSLYYNDLISIIVPHFSDISAFFMDYWSRQSWLENNYTGVSVLFLACIALTAKKSAMIYRHMWLALFGILLALGPWGGVHGVLYQWFPFFKFIRYPVRFMFIFSFALSCLAGFGLDHLLGHDKSMSHRKTLLGFILLCVLIILGSNFVPESAISSFYEQARSTLEGWTRLEWAPDVVKACLDPLIVNLTRSLMFLTWMLVILWLAFTGRVRRHILAVFILFIVFADLVEANVVEQRVGGEWLTPETSTIRTLRQDDGLFRYAASPTTMQLYREAPPYRNVYEALYSLADGIAPNHHLRVRLSYFGSYDSIYLKEGVDMSKRYREADPERSANFLNMINAKYLINSDGSFSGYFLKLRDTALGDLCVNEHALPRAFLVDKAERVSHDEQLSAIFSPSFDPKATVLMDDPPILVDQRSDMEGNGLDEGVKVLDHTLNGSNMLVSSTRPRWLFFSDAYYPGWKAYVNGRSTPIYRANYAFRAIAIPQGVSKVAWKYEPILFRIGLAVSLCTWVGCLFFIIRRRQKKHGS